MAENTVLITGAGGFIGSNLVDDQLARGKEVIALDLNLDRLRHTASTPHCRQVVGDVQEADLLQDVLAGVDTVFHLASAHLEVSKSDAYFREVNVTAVKTLLRLAHHQGVRRFVHCSSVGVYGPLEKLPADETTACHPDIIYEVTKLEGENAVRQFVEKTGFSAVVLRPAWVYGPRCPRTLKLFRTIKKKRFFMVGNGDNYRHPIYISDMLEAFELAAQQPGIDGETFLIASAEPVPLSALVRHIIEAQQIRFRPLTIPLALMTPVCLIVEGLFKLVSKEPPFSTRSLKFFTESSAFDIAKARRGLGFEPKITLLDGLEKTRQYNVDQGLL